MANIATCPKCAKQLGLPAEFAATDRAECPECRAIFSLSETIQITLPVVRVLDPAEAPPPPVSQASEELQATLKHDPSDALASNTAPLKSWEERLKCALALDSSNDSSEKSNGDREPSPETTARPRPSPSFEFELDPSPTATSQPKQSSLELELPEAIPAAKLTSSSEPVIEKTKKPTKTLADFAAKVISPVVEPDLPEMRSSSVESVDDAAGFTSELPAAIKATVTENAALAVPTISGRRGASRGFPKVAAFAIGPVVGGLLGLYGLIWLQGRKADYLGLANVLPASILPGSGEVVGGSSPAAAGSAGVIAKMEEPTEEPTSEELKRDAAVRPASATQSLPVAISTVRIDAKEFSVLVDAAATAMPEFVAGDLSTSESIQRKGQAYMALCRLAEHFDFANQRGLAPALQAKAKQAAELFGQVTFQANVREDLAHIAGRWWGYDQRPSEGIFLAGQVQATEPAASNTLCWVRLSEHSTVDSIPVLLNQQSYQVGDQIAVVGSVITDPAQIPQGVSGNRVVKAEYAFALKVGR